MLLPELHPSGAGIRTTIRSDLTFAFDAVPPGQYKIEVLGLPTQAYIREVVVGAHVLTGRILDTASVQDQPISITVGCDAGGITGRFDSAPTTSSAVAVVAFPERALTDDNRSVAATRTDQRGRFELLGLAPGSYRVYAWQNAEEDAYLDSDFVKQMGVTSAMVVVEAGRVTEVNVAVSRVATLEDSGAFGRWTNHSRFIWIASGSIVIGIGLFVLFLRRSGRLSGLHQS